MKALKDIYKHIYIKLHWDCMSSVSYKKKKWEVSVWQIILNPIREEDDLNKISMKYQF